MIRYAKYAMFLAVAASMLDDANRHGVWVLGIPSASSEGQDPPMMSRRARAAGWSIIGAGERPPAEPDPELERQRALELERQQELEYRRQLEWELARERERQADLERELDRARRRPVPQSPTASMPPSSAARSSPGATQTSGPYVFQELGKRLVLAFPGSHNGADADGVVSGSGRASSAASTGRTLAPPDSGRPSIGVSGYHKCLDEKGGVVFSDQACEVVGTDRSIAAQDPVRRPKESTAACEIVRGFAAEIADVMRREVAAADLIAANGGVGLVDRPSLQVLNYVYMFRASPEVTTAEIAALSYRRCMAGGFHLVLPGGKDESRPASAGLSTGGDIP